MKMFPSLALVLSASLILAPIAGAQSAQQLLSEAQTALIRGDTETAEKQFKSVLRIEPRNQTAINYLRMIQAGKSKGPKGNDQEKQLASVVIPKVEFREATLGSALDYLKQTVSK